jgi:2-phosphosulfolactate phosphatase
MFVKKCHPSIITKITCIFALRMKKIETCISPELIQLYQPKGKTILIVDIFRATTTMIAAISHGIDHIIPFRSLQACQDMVNDGYIIAGERDGKQAEGFDLGNSPIPFLTGKYEGKKLAMTTTNGTVAIDSVKDMADEILIGAFVNLEATAIYLKKSNRDLIIYCAGWKGKFNLEDSLYAGAVAELLETDFSTECDSTIALRNLYQKNKKNLRGFLSQASHAKRLQNQNIENDIDYALSCNLYDILGILKGEKIIAL